MAKYICAELTVKLFGLISDVVVVHPGPRSVLIIM